MCFLRAGVCLAHVLRARELAPCARFTLCACNFVSSPCQRPERTIVLVTLQIQVRVSVLSPRGSVSELISKLQREILRSRDLPRGARYTVSSARFSFSACSFRAISRNQHHNPKRAPANLVGNHQRTKHECQSVTRTLSRVRSKK